MDKQPTIRVYAEKNGEREEISDPFNLRSVYEEVQDADSVYIRFTPSTKNQSTIGSLDAPGISLRLHPQTLWAILILIDSWSEDIDFVKAAQSIKE